MNTTKLLPIGTMVVHSGHGNGYVIAHNLHTLKLHPYRVKFDSGFEESYAEHELAWVL